MKNVFRLATGFVVGLLIFNQSAFSQQVSENKWYFVLEFKSTGRTFQLDGPFSSKLACETDELVKIIMKAGKKSNSNLKCINEVPDIQ